MNMMNLGSHQSLFAISFSSFELRKLNVLLPKSFIMSSTQAMRTTHAP